MINQLGSLFGFKGINVDINPTINEGPETRSGLVADVQDGNHIVIRDGYIQKAPGLVYLNGISAPLGMSGYQTVMALPTYINDSGRKNLMVITPKRFYHLGANGLFSHVGSPDINPGEFITFGNIVNRLIFAARDTMAIYSWDGSRLTQMNPEARMVVTWMNHLFLLRPIVDGEEDRRGVWWSFPGNPDLWPETSRLTIATGDEMVRGIPLDDIMVIYFRGSIYRLYLIDAESGFGALPICENIGLEAPGAVASGPGVHFFLSREGVFALRGSGSPIPLSWGKFNKFVVEEMDPLNISKAVAHFSPRSGLFYLAFPSVGSSANDTLLIYDANGGNLVSKRKFSDLPGINCVSEIDPAVYGINSILNNKSVVVFGLNDGTIAHEDYAGHKVLGKNVASWVRLHPTKLYNFQLFKRLLQVELMGEFGENQNFVLSVHRSGFCGDTPSTYDGSAIAESSERVIFYTDDVAKEFTLELTDNGADTGFKIQNVVMRGFQRTEK